MKKVIIFLMLLFPLLSYGQLRIEMEKDGGVYKIPCLVNGAKMKMVFDTGASKVSLSLAMANYLYENDYITANDIKGTGQSVTADGSVIDNTIVNLKCVEIGGLKLENVEAWVSSTMDAPLLLGQTAIKKLGSITIEGNSLIINRRDFSYTQEDIEQWQKELDDYWNDENYYASISILEKMRNHGGLSPNGYSMYATALYATGQNVENICNEYFNHYDPEEDMKSTANVTSNLACQLRESKDYEEAIKWYNKSISYYERINDIDALAIDYYGLSCCYSSKDNYLMCNTSIDNAIKYQCKALKIVSGGIKNYWLLQAAYLKKGINLAMWRTRVDLESEKYFLKSYKCGNTDALRYLQEFKDIYNK